MVKREDSQAADGDSSSAPDGLDRHVVMYYSASWQILESRVDDESATSSGEDSRTQQFWGSRYIDDAVMFRTKVREGSGETRRSDQDFAAEAYGEPL